MTGITDGMTERIRESLPALQQAEAGALVPIKEMSPHYFSTNGDHPQNGLVKLFAVTVDGETYHIYLKQH